MSHCTQCGASIEPPDARFCPRCGAPAATEVQPATEVHPADPPLTDEIRMWGVAAHLSGLIGVTSLPALIGPLVVFLLRKDAHPFIADQAREALNFQISVLIYIVAAGVFSLATIGLGLVLVVPLAILAAIAWLLVVILAAVKANSGESFRYPLTIRMIR